MAHNFGAERSHQKQLFCALHVYDLRFQKKDVTSSMTFTYFGFSKYVSSRFRGFLSGRSPSQHTWNPSSILNIKKRKRKILIKKGLKSSAHLQVSTCSDKFQGSAGNSKRKPVIATHPSIHTDPAHLFTPTPPIYSHRPLLPIFLPNVSPAILIYSLLQKGFRVKTTSQHPTSDGVTAHWLPFLTLPPVT